MPQNVQNKKASNLMKKEASSFTPNALITKVRNIL